MSDTSDEDLYFVVYTHNNQAYVATHTRETILNLLAALGREVVSANLDCGTISFDGELHPGELLIIKGQLARVTPPARWGIE